MRTKYPDVLSLISPRRPQHNVILNPYIFGGSGGSGPAFIAGDFSIGSDSGTATSAALDTTGATLIVVAAISYSGGTVSGVSDNKGNTYTALITFTGGGAANITLYYSASPTVGAGHVVTLTGGSIFPAIGTVAFSVVTGFDTQNGNGTSSNTIQPGSVTPSVGNSVIVTGLNNWTSGLATINSGFTAFAAAGSSDLGGGIAYLIQASPSAVNPSWSWSSSNVTSAAIAVFN